MAMIIAPTSNDTELGSLLRDVDCGKMQLPDFQRGWTWDDGRIRGILSSLSQGYPMGAIMCLQYGNESVRFKYRTIEGVTARGAVPEYLILDGQQRLTSMYRATFSRDAVDTVTEKKKEIRRYYYFDIVKCLDDNAGQHHLLKERAASYINIPLTKRIKEMER